LNNMNLAKIIGSIWATQKDPQLNGIKMLLIQPLDGNKNETGQPLIALDSVGAGSGEIVIYITSSEAVIPLRNKPALSDATIIGIVDTIEVFN
jgi:microcompartment protein CcmK/EutM